MLKQNVLESRNPAGTQNVQLLLYCLIISLHMQLLTQNIYTYHPAIMALETPLFINIVRIQTFIDRRFSWIFQCQIWLPENIHNPYLIVLHVSHTRTPLTSYPCRMSQAFVAEIATLPRPSMAWDACGWAECKVLPHRPHRPHGVCGHGHVG